MPKPRDPYTGDKGYVGMALCYLCQKPKEILLNKRLTNTLPREATYDREPCDECKRLMEQGVILISVAKDATGDNPYRTGGWVVITEGALRRIIAVQELADEIASTRVCFVPDDAWDALGLPRGSNEAASAE